MSRPHPNFVEVTPLPCRDWSRQPSEDSGSPFTGPAEESLPWGRPVSPNPSPWEVTRRRGSITCRNLSSYVDPPIEVVTEKVSLSSLRLYKDSTAYFGRQSETLVLRLSTPSKLFRHVFLTNQLPVRPTPVKVSVTGTERSVVPKCPIDRVQQFRIFDEII